MLRAFKFRAVSLFLYILVYNLLLSWFTANTFLSCLFIIWPWWLFCDFIPTSLASGAQISFLHLFKWKGRTKRTFADTKQSQWF